MLKNLTITAEEKVLRWLKHEAVEKGVSVSKLVGEILADKMRGQDSYWQAYESWKKLKPIAGLDASKRPSREEIHERDSKILRGL